MPAEQFANNAQTALASAVDDNPATTSIVVEDASDFPSAVPFRIRIGDELMRVTARGGTNNTTWTVERELEDTEAAAHAVGAMVVQVLTAEVMESLAALVAAQTANRVLAGPTNGADAAPTFRALVAADLPGAVTGALVPSGMIGAFARTTAPSGWLVCDGSAVSRSTYADLFSAIGTTWGAGNGSTTFNLPDFRRRTAVGSGGSATGTLGNAVGNTGGSETHTLTTNEMPSHNHAAAGSGVFLQTLSAGAAFTLNYVSGSDTNVNQYNTTANAGGGNSHNNMPPSAVVLMCIKT